MVKGVCAFMSETQLLTCLSLLCLSRLLKSKQIGKSVLQNSSQVLLPSVIFKWIYFVSLYPHGKKNYFYLSLSPSSNFMQHDILLLHPCGGRLHDFIVPYCQVVFNRVQLFSINNGIELCNIASKLVLSCLLFFFLILLSTVD